MPGEYSDDTQTTGTLAVGALATGRHESGDDRDWFAVTLDAGRIYRFDLEGTAAAAGTLYDRHLRGIPESNGNPIAGTADNNTGEGRNAREIFTATEGGAYYVSDGARSNQQGTYTLSVEEAL